MPVLSVRDQAGRRKVRWVKLNATGKRQAQAECARLIAERSGYAESGRITVEQFLERWLDHIRTQVSPRTHERYAEIVRKNLIPALGAIQLARLQPAQISAAYANALTSGRRDGEGGFLPERFTTCTGFLSKLSLRPSSGELWLTIRPV